jgi:hypothetical protein
LIFSLLESDGLSDLLKSEERFILRIDLDTLANLVNSVLDLVNLFSVLHVPLLVLNIEFFVSILLSKFTLT